VREVPFVDLDRIHSELEPELSAAFKRVLTQNSFIQGPEVKAFEQEWANYLGIKHAIGCANGTDAIVLALLAAGIGQGDEVITVSNTFFATVEAIVSVRATPVLVDVREGTGVMDPLAVEKAITSRTKAIIPVHLYGHAVDIDPILAVAKSRGIKVFEDAAQGHGGKYKGRSIGTLGDAAAFSFYPGKNLGAFGDAGAIVTNDDKLAARLRSLRDHGRTEKYKHHEFAWNMRLDGLQAAFLRAKLPQLDSWVADRRKIGEFYREQLKSVRGIRLLETGPGVEHAYHLFVILHPERDRFAAELKGLGIQTGVHYPLGCHQQPAWLETFDPVSLPVTEQIAAQCLSLPIFGRMKLDEAERVAAAVKRLLK
jgi:dTDP-4-amino-4,6-dideoxygalactose transaminase